MCTVNCACGKIEKQCLSEGEIENVCVCKRVVK